MSSVDLDARPGQKLYAGPIAHFGTFRCPASTPDFHRYARFTGHNLITFPRTSVELTMVGKEIIISSPNIVVFYEHGQEYFRKPIKDEADNCEWFHFCPGLINRLVGEYDARLADQGSSLFRRSFGPISVKWLLFERQLIDYFQATKELDRWWIDEASLTLLHGILADNYPLSMQSKRKKEATIRQHRALVTNAKRVLIDNLSVRLSLRQIAAELFTSPYHLSRIFREHTGMTLLHYSEQLRLRIAHERLPDFKSELSSLALEVGYKNHSHFTYAFRRAFGAPPSQFLTTQRSY